jgi:hypothetical protein
MRTILTAFFVAAALAASAEEKRPPVIVGASRWDAWTGGELTAQMERTLGPRKYHFRLPWFAEVRSNDTVHIDGSRQEVMDREIDYAADAGLNYWAFLLDEEASPMSLALKQYLTSAKRNRIDFCLILHNTFAVGEERWPAERDRVVALMKTPGYQMVLGGRPLVYVLDANYANEFPLDRLKDLRESIEGAGLYPYMVFMGWDPEGDFKRQAANGFHAVSAHAYGGIQSNFVELAQSLEKSQWQNAAKAGVPYIPLVTTGWDKQPRKDNPVPWEQDHGYLRQRFFPSTAKPEEIAAHLDRAIAFVEQHPKVGVASTILIFAWNEFDAGGWLEPTWTPSGKPNTARLDAIGKLLKTRRAAPPALQP